MVFCQYINVIPDSASLKGAIHQNADWQKNGRCTYRTDDETENTIKHTHCFHLFLRICCKSSTCANYNKPLPPFLVNGFCIIKPQLNCGNHSRHDKHYNGNGRCIALFIVGKCCFIQISGKGLGSIGRPSPGEGCHQIILLQCPDYPYNSQVVCRSPHKRKRNFP